MICRECAACFDLDECATVAESMPYGDGYARELQGVLCPQCGSSRVDEERVCSSCEQVCSPHEMEEGLCRLCVEETTQTLEWMWDMLSPAQKRWAGEHTDWMEG